MNTNSKLTGEQREINTSPRKFHPTMSDHGWIEITGPESLEMDPLSFQLDPRNPEEDLRRGFMSEHRDGFYVDGYDAPISAAVIAENFIAIRILPSFGELQSLKDICERHDAWADGCIAKNDALSFKIIELEKQLAAANNGKTLRDEIAIAAMQVEIRNNPHYSADKAAACSYAQADAMLKARKKGDTNAE